MKNIIILLSIFILLLSGCSNNTDKNGPNVVEIVAKEYAFESPEKIPAGWTRFRMVNEGNEEHFMLINPLSEGVSIDAIREGGRFIQGLHNQYDKDLITKEDIYDSLSTAFGKPNSEVNYNGGPGFVSMGHTTEATTYLEPGRYVIECYIRAPNGVQHNVLGMMTLLEVTESAAEFQAPVADKIIVLTKNELTSDENFKAGTYTFEVEFRDHPSGYIGNDVHLIRIDENIAMDNIAKWMDVFEKDGLVSPAPVEFLGGTQERTKGEVAYFTVNLKPGEYAWVAELDYADKKWKRFTVN